MEIGKVCKVLVFRGRYETKKLARCSMISHSQRPRIGSYSKIIAKGNGLVRRFSQIIFCTVYLGDMLYFSYGADQQST